MGDIFINHSAGIYESAHPAGGFLIHGNKVSCELKKDSAQTGRSHKHLRYTTNSNKFVPFNGGTPARLMQYENCFLGLQLQSDSANEKPAGFHHPRLAVSSLLICTVSINAFLMCL